MKQNDRATRESCPLPKTAARPAGGTIGAGPLQRETNDKPAAVPVPRCPM